MKKDGLFFIKKGMIGIWKDDKRIPVTLLELPKTTLVNKDKDRSCIFVEHGGKLHKPQQGQIKSHNIEISAKAKGFLRTIDNVSTECGSILSVEKFNDIAYVDVQGLTKGKGFQGVMKRHNFKGGRASHGNSLSHRSHGGTGSGRSGPQKVFKGKKMAGHMGHESVTQLNLKVMEVLVDENIILVKGSIPGPKNSVVFVRKAIKKGVTNE